MTWLVKRLGGISAELLLCEVLTMVRHPPINMTGLSAYINALGHTLADLDCLTGSSPSTWVLQHLDETSTPIEAQNLTPEELHTFRLMHYMLDLSVEIWRQKPRPLYP